MIALLLLAACSGSTEQEDIPKPESGSPPDLERWCKTGHAVSCDTLGEAWLKGRQVPKVPARAQEWFQRACELNLPVGCYHYGESLEGAAALPHYKKACDAGHVESCYFVGMGLLEGLDMEEPDPEAGFAVLLPSCDRDSVMASCHAVGVCYRTGEGVEEDMEMAVEYFSRACAKRNHVSCTAVGTMQLAGEGMEEDPIAAANTFDRSCVAGDYDACNHLGALQVSGELGVIDYTRANMYFEKSCDGGDPQGCYNLALTYLHGSGAEPSPERAKVLFQSACDAGVEKACETLSELSGD